MIPGWGRAPGGGHGNPLKYSCLGNPRDSGAWWATVHGATESDATEVTSHTDVVELSQLCCTPLYDPIMLRRMRVRGFRVL